MHEIIAQLYKYRSAMHDQVSKKEEFLLSLRQITQNKKPVWHFALD